MSGLLRRIKRSRPADAGEAPPEGRAAETEDATPTAETPATTPLQTSADAPTQVEPPATPAADPATPPKRRRGLFRRRARTAPGTPQPAPPVLLADPSVPAGIDPADAPLRPPAGRRGRLRRRLRYLRRARELMLRDLGGLLYEIHRTGEGKVEAHATVVGAKVQRIAGLDAEAHAIETALAAPRSETVVFEPGVGGTCATCGELYGSDARFCANCGTAIGTAPAAAAPRTDEHVASEPARRAFWRRAARPTPPEAEAGAEQPGEETAAIETAKPAAEPAEPAERPAAEPPTQQQPATEQPEPATEQHQPATAAQPEPATEQQPPTGPQPPRTDAATQDDDRPRNPYPGVGNGRSEQHKPPGMSSGDPLVSRDRS